METSGPRTAQRASPDLFSLFANEIQRTPRLRDGKGSPHILIERGTVARNDLSEWAAAPAVRAARDDRSWSASPGPGNRAEGRPGRLTGAAVSRAGPAGRIGGPVHRGNVM